MPVVRIGVELEGGWRKAPPLVALLHDDVSVFRDTGYAPEGLVYRGEIALGPYIVEEMRSALNNFLVPNYPHFLDRTCGMHVHMSVTTVAEYSRLMVRQYNEKLLAHLLKWGVGKEVGENFVPRLTGQHRFCQRFFAPGAQSRSIDKQLLERRAAVNFCWNMHGTVEVRVLPMFPSPLLGIQAVEEVVNFTNLFLEEKRKKKEGWRKRMFPLERS